MLVSAYRNGVTMGTPPTTPNREPAKRGEVVGWSAAAVRRHTKWLYSVDAGALGAGGWAFTLTLRDLPADAAAWQSVRRAFIKRMERAGAIRFHWVTEWQRRGVPHLHGVVYFAGESRALDGLDPVAAIVASWLAAASAYRPSWRSQHVEAVAGPLGWLQYLSKHAARGVAHYQRQGKPAGWEKTGRLWGYGGSWPIDEPMRFDLDRAGGFRLRRLVRSWRVADARAALRRQELHPARDPELQAERLRAARRRVRSARRMLRCSDPRLSAVRGASEWVSEDTTAQLLWLLVREGHAVEQRSELEAPELVLARS